MPHCHGTRQKGQGGVFDANPTVGVDGTFACRQSFHGTRSYMLYASVLPIPSRIAAPFAVICGMQVFPIPPLPQRSTTCSKRHMATIPRSWVRGRPRALRGAIAYRARSRTSGDDVGPGTLQRNGGITACPALGGTIKFAGTSVCRHWRHIQSPLLIPPMGSKSTTPQPHSGHDMSGLRAPDRARLSIDRCVQLAYSAGGSAASVYTFTDRAYKS
jgi:hypothetical protein